MSNERKAEVNNFLGTCMDLVFGVINSVKKCLNATIYKCFRITIGRVEKCECTNIQSPLHMHKHPVFASDFKILSSGTSDWDLLIRERLF
jgi:hypothetical protein